MAFQRKKIKGRYKFLISMLLIVLTLFLINLANENSLYNVTNYVIYGNTYDDYNDVRGVYIPETLYFKIRDARVTLSNQSTLCLDGTYDMEKRRYDITGVEVTFGTCEGISEMIITSSTSCQLDRGVFEFEDDVLYSVSCERDLGFFDDKSKTLSYEYYIAKY